MDTPWGPLNKLDLADHSLCATILAEDKHQLAEGLVVENLFDQIIDVVPQSLSGAVALDIETAIADTGREPDPLHAFIWVRRQQEGLGRYLNALGQGLRTWLVRHDEAAGTFTACEWRDGQIRGERRPLATVMGELTGRRPRPFRVAASVRDANRQKVSFWGYLSDIYGSELGARVILPRLFFNHGIQPWVNGLWNLDRILVHGTNVWLLEIKHKFPFGGRKLRFGINDGELEVIRLATNAGIRCFHALLIKPVWTRESGSGYLLNRMQLKERAALIGTELDRDRIRNMFAGQQGISPDHTTLSGEGENRYRSLPATAFSQIGLITEAHAQLGERLGQALGGKTLAAVTDQWLRDLRVE